VSARGVMYRHRRTAAGAAPRWRLPALLLLAGLWAVLPLPAAAQTDAAGAAAADDAAAADAEASPPSPEEALATLRNHVHGLEQGVKSLQTQIDANRDAVASEAERLNAELKRMDPLALRLDALAQQLDQAQGILEQHETRIEDNSVKLYEQLMGVDNTDQSIAALRADVQRLDLGIRRLSAPLVAADAPDGSAVGNVIAADEAETVALLPFALGLLLPAGVLLYGASRDARTGAVGGDSSAATAAVLLALAGAVLGFVLLGVGILNGESRGGFIGAPFALLPTLLRLSPEEALPSVAVPMLQQFPLVVAMTLLAVLGAGRRLSGVAGLLLGLALGGLLLPVFGHWSGFPGMASEAGGGWLTRLGFSDGGGIVATALVGGAAALGLGLSGGERAPANGADAHEPALLVFALLLLWIGWLEPRLMGANAEDATALVLGSWACVLGALLTSALLNGLFLGGQGRLRGLPAAMVAGAVAAPALGVGASLAVALLFGVTVGLLHALLTPALRHRGGAVELPAAFAVAGLAAGLAPVLVGPEGLLFAPVAEGMPVQLLGVMTALGFGLGGGLTLGLLLRLLPGGMRQPAATAAPAAPGMTGAAAAAAA
jgi:uncharacterized small protein (DUF1192 family)